MDTNDENFLADLLVRWHDELELGRDVPAEILCRECPRLASELASRIEDMKARLKKLSRLLDESVPQTRSAPLNSPDLHMLQSSPQMIGSYRIEKTLGTGGFGIVYLGHDERLKRAVAIKVLQQQHSTQEDAARFQDEARVLASLTHPNIVQVYDFGFVDGFPFFVSQYINGGDLAKEMRKAPMIVERIAEIVMTIARALAYAHERGFYHRDIKPGNILIDTDGKPYLADLGLHLKRQDYGKGRRSSPGTPAYMSPEQASGEGQMVEGSSDVFSLGIVFYELLTGERPFKGDSIPELLDRIASLQFIPPRQIKPTIPDDLERTCLKALRHHTTGCYTTASDLASDLDRFLRPPSLATPQPAKVEISVSLSPPQTHASVSGSTASLLVTPTSPAPIGSSERPVTIMPRGLRSFGKDDSHFFLTLLPGPCDAAGVPQCVSFWIKRVEETDPDNTFTVGLILGPSGSGKSSLVKAGLLPHLPDKVISVYVESTAEGTETGLLNRLRRRCNFPHTHLGLKETLEALNNRDQYLPNGKRVLIVLDQFEQWLHARKGERNTELVQALRHCNCTKVQCVVMVRTEFGLEARRFLKEIDPSFEFNESRNSAVVDLFLPDHAKRVLSAFGRAYGNILDYPHALLSDEEKFLEQAVADLAQNRMVVCVRLALFAEMMKGKPWTAASLKNVGGAEGIGFTFLEDTFSSDSANPTHKLHQKAARAVLNILLPDSGTNIKGHMRSYVELLEASGYATRPSDFRDLIRILDTELRLITPTDPEGQLAGESSHDLQPGAKYYQLSHDYLVPTLRRWLNSKQEQTWRGRAELLLAERAGEWKVRQDDRHLPKWWEWLQVRCLTKKKNWIGPQREMMQRADQKYRRRFGVGVLVILLVGLTDWFGHFVLGGIIAIGFILLFFGMYLFNRRTQRRYEEHHNANIASGKVDRLLDAHISQVPDIIAEMRDYRQWTYPQLKHAIVEAAKERDCRKQLHASLALLSVDAVQVDYLFERLLAGDPDEIVVIRDALYDHREVLIQRLWDVLEQPEKPSAQKRLRAACALATYDRDSHRWKLAADPIVEQLLMVNPAFLQHWMDALRPAKTWLLSPLCNAFRDRQDGNAAQRNLAASIVMDYAANQVPTLADMLAEADEKQFDLIFPSLEKQRDHAVILLRKTLALDLDSQETHEQKERLAHRQANVAVALLRMDHAENIWPLLRHRSDPRVRSYLIHRLSVLGVDAGIIIKRLEKESDITIRRALILSLGEYSDKDLSHDIRNVLLPKLQDIYSKAADPGLHGASEWLLRTWKQEAWLKRVNEDWAIDKGQREKRIEDMNQMMANKVNNAEPRWYVNGQAQTMVVVPGPVMSLIGSPQTEPGRDEDERQHERRIGRTFAIAAKPITVAQFRRFQEGFNSLVTKYAPTEDCPVHRVTWHEATAYCNWLSEQEGIAADQWCYETESDGRVAKPKEKCLSLKGYRLPTEAEMEYAIRAGAVTSRCYGESVELLVKYGWFVNNSANSSRPVGSKKPNDLGLFDMHGNVWVWCHGRYIPYPHQGQGPVTTEDTEETLNLNNEESRVFRGGSFTANESNVRSASRIKMGPSAGYYTLGFRVARTIEIK